MASLTGARRRYDVTQRARRGQSCRCRRSFGAMQLGCCSHCNARRAPARRSGGKQERRRRRRRRGARPGDARGYVSVTVTTAGHVGSRRGIIGPGERAMIHGWRGGHGRHDGDRRRGARDGTEACTRTVQGMPTVLVTAVTAGAPATATPGIQPIMNAAHGNRAVRYPEPRCMHGFRSASSVTLSSVTSSAVTLS